MMIAFRLIHVFAGVFWAGAVFFAVSFLLPSVRDAGPAGGAVMRHLVGIRKYPRAMFIVAIVTTVSGFALYGLNISLSNGAFARSRAGMTYGLGGVAAILTLLVGAVILTPASARLGVVTASIAGGTPTPEQAAEIGHLQARLTFGSRLAAVCLAITVLTMAVGRYV